MQRWAQVVLRLVVPFLAIVTIQMVVVQIIALGCDQWLGSREMTLELFETQLLSLWYTVVAIPVLLVFFARDVRKNPAKYSPQGLGKTLVWVAILGLSACVILNLALELSGLWRYSTYFSETLAESLYAPPLGQQIVLMVLLTPLCEELAFRGLMFRGLRQWVPFGMAAVSSAGMFGLFHGNLYQGVYAFGLGLLLAWVYERTQAFIAPVVLHSCANLMSVVLARPFCQEWMMAHPAASWAVSGLCLVVMVVSVVVIGMRTVRQKGRG